MKKQGTGSQQPASGTVSIDGTVKETETLTANTSGLSDPNSIQSFEYQWNRNGAPISGATGSTYLLVVDDVGANITVDVTVIDGYGNSETPITSSAVGPVDPNYAYYNETNTLTTWGGLTNGGSRSIVNEYGRSWVRLYRAGGGFSQIYSNSPSFSFDNSKDYKCSFYHSNVNNYNYYAHFQVGPFSWMFHRDGSDYLGMASTNDTWSNKSTHGVATSLPNASNVYYEIYYYSTSPTAGECHAYRGGVLKGTKTINKSLIHTRTKAYLNCGGDEQRVSTIIIQEI